MPRTGNIKRDRSHVSRRYLMPHQRRPSVHERNAVRAAHHNRRLIGVSALIAFLMSATFILWSSDTPVYGLYLDNVEQIFADPKATPAKASKTKASRETAKKKTAESQFDEYVTTKNETGREHWTHVAKEALAYYDLDQDWYSLILAMIKVESGGDVAIDVREDIMQAWEGDGKKIISQGVAQKGIRGGTPEASIYAGCYELSLCIADYKKYLGREPRVGDLDDVGLLAQGYNYGHRGWFKWCGKNGITSWSLGDSQAYQNSIGGIGTASHGGKVQKAYGQFA